MRDKNGQTIQQFDLIKIFHFTGARRKKYYMYKWVTTKEKYPDRLYGLHLSGSGEKFHLGWIEDNTVRDDIEILQSPLTLKKENEERRL